MQTQARAKAGELLQLPAVDAYFDDQQHFQHVRRVAACQDGTSNQLTPMSEALDDVGSQPALLYRELCSFWHPAADGEGSNGKARRYSSLKELRRQLETQGLHFCTVCLDGRKVRISCHSHIILMSHKRTAPLLSMGTC